MNIESKQRITLSSAPTYRRPIRHAPPDADHLPGVCEEPPLLPPSPHGVQAESAVCTTPGEVGEQACLPEPVARDVLDLSNASGMFCGVPTSLRVR